MSQPSLFQLPVCQRCKGTGRAHNHDLGWADTCPDCHGAGTAPAVCRICDQTANGHGSYCDRHDPDTAPIPYV